jgi:hypothetical protein
MRLLNTLEARLWEKNTVADRITEDSVELCQVGIEHMHRGALKRTLL